MAVGNRYRFINGTLVCIGEGVTIRAPSHYHGEDRMDPIQNPVDGKIYDSRSLYHQAVKNAGCVVVGDDAPTTTRSTQGSDIDWKAAVAQTLNQTDL